MGKKKTGVAKVLCQCCEKFLTKETAEEHLYILQRRADFQKRMRHLEESPSPSAADAGVESEASTLVGSPEDAGPSGIGSNDEEERESLHSDEIWAEEGKVSLPAILLVLTVEAPPPMMDVAEMDPAFAFSGMAEYV
jgi:hypothetical protein